MRFSEFHGVKQNQIISKNTILSKLFNPTVMNKKNHSSEWFFYI